MKQKSFIFLVALFATACSAGSNSYHCQNEKRGRMISWTKDFVQYGNKVYFKKHVPADEYEYRKPLTASFYGKVYQEELDGKNTDAYSLQQTEERIVLQYYWGSVFVAYQRPSSEKLHGLNKPREKVWNELINGEIEYLIQYAMGAHRVEKVVFDIPQKTLTEYLPYPFPFEGTGAKRKIIYKNGKQYDIPLGEITPEDKERMNQSVLGAEGEPRKYQCKKDEFLKGFFRKLGNKLFWIFSH